MAQRATLLKTLRAAVPGPGQPLAGQSFSAVDSEGCGRY